VPKIEGAFVPGKPDMKRPLKWWIELIVLIALAGLAVWTLVQRTPAFLDVFRQALNQQRD
jgi:hypothetical protein